GLVGGGAAPLGPRLFAGAAPRLESKALGVEQLVVVVPAAHRVRQRRLRSLRSLEGERWLGFPPERGQPDSFGRLLERTLIEAGFADPRYTPVDSLTAQKRLVEAGLGVALMPRSSVPGELRIGSLRPMEIQGARLEQPVVEVRRRRGYESPLAMAFLTLLRDFTPDLRRQLRARPHRA